MFVKETVAKWFCECMPCYAALESSCYSAASYLNIKLLGFEVGFEYCF
jgi:hypothetical protein